MMDGEAQRQMTWQELCDEMVRQRERAESAERRGAALEAECGRLRELALELFGEMEYLGNQYKRSHSGYVSAAYESLSSRARAALFASQSGDAGAQGREEKSR